MLPTLNDLKTLAHQAGAILLDGYGQEHEIGHKGLVDLVTEVDRRSEEFIVAAIRERFGDDPIVTEESGFLKGATGHRWYIDPLDGTVNYAHGVPIFAVSIAYAEADRVTLGVVYDPTRDELFSAERGQGAWLNDHPISVTPIEDLMQSLLVTGFPYDTWNSEANNLENYARFARRSQGVRRLGSAALDLCYVACGRFDGYWEMKLSAWDIAAGALIAEQAGARVTNIKGGPNYLTPPYSILAANPSLHSKMQIVLSEA